MPPQPAADAALTHTGSSTALHPTLLPFHGPIPFGYPPVGYVYVGANQGLSIRGHNEIVAALIMEGGEVGNGGGV